MRDGDKVDLTVRIGGQKVRVFNRNGGRSLSCQGTFEFPDGTRKQKTYSLGITVDRADACRPHIERLLGRIVSGEMGGRREYLLVEDAVKIYVRAAQPKGSQLEHVRKLEKALGHRPLKSLTDEEIADWGWQLKPDGEDPSPGTVRRRLGVVRAVFKAAREGSTRVREQLPELVIKLPPEPQGRDLWATPEQRRALIGAMHADLQAFVAFLFMTGCRRGEAMALRWRDVKEDARVVTFASRKGREGREKKRTVPLNGLGWWAIEDARRRWAAVTARHGLEPGPDNLVFVRDDGGSLLKGKSVKWFYERWWAAVASVEGLHERFSPHCCRHTFASLLIQDGEDINEVGEMLGHSGHLITKRYVHLAPRKRRETLERLDDGWRPSGLRVAK